MSYDALIPNIGPAQRRRRARFGVAALTGAVVAGVGMIVLGLPVPLRLLTVPLLFAGFQGVIQAREKT